MKRLAACLLLFAMLPWPGAGAQPAALAAPQSYLLGIAGSHALRCGSFERRARERAVLTAEEFAAMTQCVTTAWRDGKAFIVSDGGMGVDSYVQSGVIGLRDQAGLFRFGYDSSPCGGPHCAPKFSLNLCNPVSAGVDLDLGLLCDIHLRPPSAQAGSVPNMVVRLAGPTCKFPDIRFPPDFEVIAAGAYSGRPLGYQIDQSGHEATQIDVKLNRPDKPVVLMLGAYEPTVWTFSHAARSSVVAVLVSGHHRQAVAGLDRLAPVLNTSENRACARFYVSRDELGKLNPLARQHFGRPVDVVYLADKGEVLIGDPLPAAQWTPADWVKPESFRDASAPLAGAAGLAEAVAKGMLRPASRDDAAAWARATAQARTVDRPPVAGQDGANEPLMSVRNAYVVLGPMRYPAGLYGANSASFFIPRGVPRPTGEPGHSSVYDFNAITCSGPLCDRR